MVESLQEIVEASKTTLQGPGGRQKAELTEKMQVFSAKSTARYLARLSSGFAVGPEPTPRTVTESILCLHDTPTQ